MILLKKKKPNIDIILYRFQILALSVFKKKSQENIKMSLKRLGELKEILLKFDHEPDHFLRSVMKNGGQSQADISNTNEYLFFI